MEDRSLAALLLTNRLTDVSVKPYTAQEFWALCQRVDIDQLPGATQASLAEWGLDESDTSRIEALLQSASALAVAVDNLEQSGVRVVSALDPEFPAGLRERLRSGCPPVMFMAGDLTIVDEPGLAIVGSRNVDEEGADVARTAATSAVDRGQTVVSGGARGVDQLAMSAAFEAEGKVIGVLAEGLAKRLRQPDVRQAVRDGRVLMCSPFVPTAGFSVGNAMGRNKVIYALAERALVVASDEGSGGTWAGATEAIKKQITRVAVWRGPGEGPGNEALVREGAASVERVDQIFELDPLEQAPHVGVEQITMF